MLTSSPASFQGKEHRVILVFSKSWPQSLPKIRFLGQLKRLGLEKLPFLEMGDWEDVDC